MRILCLGVGTNSLRSFHAVVFISCFLFSFLEKPGGGGAEREPSGTACGVVEFGQYSAFKLNDGMTRSIDSVLVSHSSSSIGPASPLIFPLLVFSNASEINSTMSRDDTALSIAASGSYRGPTRTYPLRTRGKQEQK